MTTLNFKQDYILENERVVLKPLQLEDLSKLESYAINEPEIWDYSAISPAGKIPFQKYIQTAVEGRKIQNQYPFIVFDKLTQEYAGATRFYDFQGYHKTVQLGYTWYGKKFQRTGLNRNCKLLLLEFAFEQIGMERVQFLADLNNARSITAMKNIGCIEEGILRKHVKNATGRRDSIVLSILKEEWFGEVKKELLIKIRAVE